MQEAHGPPTWAGCNVAVPRTPHAHGRAGARTRAHTPTRAARANDRSARGHGRAHKPAFAHDALQATRVRHAGHARVWVCGCRQRHQRRCPALCQAAPVVLSRRRGLGDDTTAPTLSGRQKCTPGLRRCTKLRLLDVGANEVDANVLLVRPFGACVVQVRLFDASMTLMQFASPITRWR